MGEVDIIRNRIETFSAILNEIPNVRYIGDPILRTPVVPATLEEGSVIGTALGEVLLHYRKLAGYGRGFAAPQIGISRSVFTTYVNGNLQTFINPKIIETSKRRNYYRELCLSAGILSADVRRPQWISMRWTDPDGANHEEKFDGFLARLFQHEEGHLRGELPTDICEPGGLEICTFDPLKEQLRTSR